MIFVEDNIENEFWEIRQVHEERVEQFSFQTLIEEEID